jgi:hypothetical protein
MRAFLASLLAVLTLGTTGKAQPKDALISDGTNIALFEAREAVAFTTVVAGEIRQAAMTLPKLSCVMLAQASMTPAAERLTDLRVPVPASPELALRAALEI